jgi:uncharacterized protein YnzC (UPF0291/DUF896 family)
MVTYHWNALTNFIKGKERVLSADERKNFALRRSGKLRDLRNSMKNIYNAVRTITPDGNTVERLKKRIGDCMFG